ncbi:MAG: hypothetical protein U9O24_04630 [Campylobacterota bacterium]|nr:hypothetical protein [Campylobacterota bacterium]
MNKNNYILMVFEGEKTEKFIFDSLKEHFLQNKTNRIIYGFHCGEIYSLYNKLQNGNDESLFFILKDKLQAKNPELKDIVEEYVESIYLFFDYDNHAPTADDNKIQNMLETFNDEFDNGKLFISYPMVEAIKHLKESIEFKDTIAISEQQYKQIVRNNCNHNLKQLGEVNMNMSKENWHYIISEHCKKAHFIVNDNFEFPNTIIEQIEIFTKQKEKYIDKDNKVSVISSFPLFLLDYYGIDKFND